MVDVLVTYTFIDVQGGTTTRSYSGTFTDIPTAVTASSNLMTDLQAITDAQIVKEELSVVTDIAGAPNAGSTVFENVQASVNLGGTNKKGALFVPSPKDAIMTGNSLDTADSLWTAFTDNFGSGANLWRVSDGEYISATNNGKRVYRSSGVTNLV